MNKKNVLIIASLVFVLAIAISSVLLFNRNSKLNAEAARGNVMVHSSEITGDGITETNGTTSPSLSVENETQETAAVQLSLFENADEQVAQEMNDNEMLLASCEDFLYVGMGKGSLGVATCICEHTIEMNAAMDSFLGWPSGDEYPDSEYASSRLYISQLIGAWDGSAEVPATNLYPDTPFGAQMYAVNYCLFNQTQFPLDGNFKYCFNTLSEYMKAGHPTITTINSMVLSKDDPKSFDEIKSVLQATIQTDVGEYFVYLVFEKRADASTGFKILDMVKVS